MATVTIAHHWDDESVTTIEVEVESSYPDAVQEARSQALQLWRDVMAGMETAEPDDE